MARGQLLGQRAAPPSALEKMVLAQKTPVTLGSLAVGETVTLNVDGAPWEWIVVHQGKPSSVYDDTCDGTWLLMRDLYQKGRYGTGSDGRTYSLSVLRSTLNTRIYNLLDQSVREAIRQTNLPARVSGDRVFPLTCTELGLSQTYMSTEGAVLQYFAGADAQKRVAKYGGVAMGYWTPSPYTYSSAGVWYVTSGGSAENIGNVQAEYGVRPAIILPADFVLPAPATLTDLQGNPLSISAEQISGGVKMVTGSYVGTGQYGVDRKNRIVFEFRPKFVLVQDRRSNIYRITITEKTTSADYLYSGLLVSVEVDVDGTSVSWYSNNSADYQLNRDAWAYDYVALG